MANQKITDNQDLIDFLKNVAVPYVDGLIVDKEQHIIDLNDKTLWLKKNIDDYTSQIDQSNADIKDYQGNRTKLDEIIAILEQ